MVPWGAKSGVVRERLGSRCLSIPQVFSALCLSLNGSEKWVYLKKILFVHPNLSWSREEISPALLASQYVIKQVSHLGLLFFDAILRAFPTGPELWLIACNGTEFSDVVVRCLQEGDVDAVQCCPFHSSVAFFLPHLQHIFSPSSLKTQAWSL